MSKFFRILSILLISLCTVSCQNKKATLEISVSPSTVDASGGTATITIVTNGYWTIAPPEGAEISPESGNGNGTVNVTVEPNLTGRKRTLKFCAVSTIEYSSATVTKSVTQPTVK